MRARMRAQIADRGFNILHLSGEHGLAAQAVVQRGHHIAARGQPCEHGWNVSDPDNQTGVGGPHRAAVNIDHQRYRLVVPGRQIRSNVSGR